jgi:L-ascorbate metabolism protein UlaG (beta-lactamase superfamily)
VKAIRFAGKVLLWLVIIVCIGVGTIPGMLDQPYYHGPASHNFDGERFFNPGPDDTSAPPSGRSRTSFFRAMLFGSDERAVWPESVPVRQARPAPRIEGDRMVATWIGHATVLIQTQDLNILTDPIYAERAGPFGIGPQRVTVPGVAFDDLPKIDLVVVSHNHYDHMDTATLKRLWDRDRPLIVTSLGNDTLLRRAGVESRPLDWGGIVPLRNGVSVAVTRNHHWSSRWFADRNRALWSSFVIRTPKGIIMFAGDTGFGDGKWPGEAAALGSVRLALIPIGAFRFRNGQMETASHIGPHQAVDVFRRSRAAFAIPIHWGTFQLSYEERETPPRMLAEVLKCHGLPPDVFAARPVGEAVEVPVANPPAAVTPGPACLESEAITGLR